MGLQKYQVHAWIGNTAANDGDHLVSAHVGWHHISIHCGQRTGYPKQLPAIYDGEQDTNLVSHSPELLFDVPETCQYYHGIKIQILQELQLLQVYVEFMRLNP